MTEPAAPGTPPRRWPRAPWPWLAMAAVLALTVFQLRLQGRSWWCACGRPNLWTPDAYGPHNSQHLFDPYTFTHILHGIVFCGLLAWALPRLAPAWRLCLAVAAESLWEVVENTAFVIERYRAATAALGYEGDTVANSLGDIVSTAVGFVLARYLGPWCSLALFVATEVLLLITIRDSLLLNVLMLVFPVEGIRAWQGAQ